LAPIGVRLEPHDEYMHELGPEPNFNESMYFNFIDPEQSVAGFFRLGNRANEGTAEMTACLYVPDGPVAFMFRRPEIKSNDAFDAGGMRFDVLEPFTALRVSYSGPVLILDDPWKLSDPGTAFRHSPTVDAEVELAFTGCSPPVGGEPDKPGEHPGEEFARGHYEQLVQATGTVTVGPDTWVTTGFGLRDHSWGPRYWQAPWYYRWLTGNFGSDFGFMGSHIARRDSDGLRSGFVWRDGTLHVCDDMRLRTTKEGRDRTHRTLELILRSGSQRWTMSGRVEALVPLRNRRTAPDGTSLVTRISEGLTRWETDEGRIGYGLAEYLDQIVDGSPVGAGLD
jgi:hypothetical protein